MCLRRVLFFRDNPLRRSPPTTTNLSRLSYTSSCTSSTSLSSLSQPTLHTSRIRTTSIAPSPHASLSLPSSPPRPSHPRPDVPNRIQRSSQPTGPPFSLSRTPPSPRHASSPKQRLQDRRCCRYRRRCVQSACRRAVVAGPAAAGAVLEADALALHGVGLTCSLAVDPAAGQRRAPSEAFVRVSCLVWRCRRASSGVIRLTSSLLARVY